MSNQTIILCSDPECRFVEADMARLRNAGRVIVSESHETPTLLPLIADADILVVSCFALVPADLIAAGRKLRGIVKYGVGVDNIDLAAAMEQRVPVANCPDYGSGTVADHAFALMIALARKLMIQDTEFRRQGWYWPDDRFCGVDLEGKTLGIIGLGKIGQKMAQRALGFDMQVIACDPYVNPVSATVNGCQIPLLSLNDLLSSSDFVSIHCTLTPETRLLIGEQQIRAMKPTAYLIDVSRGAIIDEPALVRALQEGRLAGAGLDVFPTEPLPHDHPLLTLPNVVLTPHLAWYTFEAAARQSQQAADAVLVLLAGGRPYSLVV